MSSIKLAFTEKLLRRIMSGDIYKTLVHSRLFGVSGQGANPWAKRLANAQLQHLQNQISRHYNLASLGDDALQAFSQKAKPLMAEASPFRKYKAIENLAKEYGVTTRSIPSRVLRKALGIVADLNPLKLVAGSNQSRLQFMHDLWEGGLIGKGSAVHKAFTPKPEFWEILNKYKDVAKGTAGAPTTSELGKDALTTMKSIATPLLLGGSIWPISSIAHRAIKPEAYKESLPHGALKDLGWFTGLTTGIPLGVVGVSAGSQLGTTIGDTLGKAISNYPKELKADLAQL